MTTPAQLAKEFAIRNGFKIESIGRRYRVTREGAPLVVIAEVGGYPAALNAMERYIDAQKTDAAIAQIERIVPPSELLSQTDIQRKPGERDSSLRRRIKVSRGLLPVTHRVEWRYKGGKTHSQPFSSHFEALKSVRKMMSNKRMRPEYINIRRVGA